MATRNGTAGADDILAGVFGDLNVGNNYSGLGGNDTLAGGYLADVLNGGEGDDAIYGNDGSDRITDSSGSNGLWGDAGDDIIYAAGENNTIDGGTGDDSISFSFGDVTAYGGLGDDYLSIYSATFLAYGGSGDDEIRISSGSSGEINAGAGDDYIAVDNSTAVIDGGQGDDVVSILNTADRRVEFRGGAGDDVLIASAGQDTFYGDAGDDTVNYALAGAAVTVDLARKAAGGAAAGDIWVRVENVTGSDFNDNLRGNGDYNYLFGGGGGDVISGGAGGDLLDGGDGVDRLDYSRSNAGVTVSLATGEASGGHAEGDEFSRFESLEGSGYADVLTGDALVNRLFGGYGADRLTGGGAGDSLYGGTGADRFVFLDVADSRSSSGRDVIYDFSRAEGDKIDLSGIDASIAAGGNQAFTFIGTGAFTNGVQGQVNYRVFGGYVMIYGDVNGDGAGDFSIQVQQVASLAASDFVL